MALVLPSEYLLVLYKNCVNQITGFNDEVFTWMHNEAERLGIPQDGRVGGLIIDEMAIQSDLRIIDCLGDGRLRCMKALFAEAPSMFIYFTSNPHVDKQ
jgi:hypothetical protein